MINSIKKLLALTASVTRIPVSSIIGSKAFFSLGHCLSPLVGFYTSPGYSIVWISARMLLSWLLGAAITFQIPQIGGALYLSSKHWSKALLPIICMVLFWAYPLGDACWYYPLYWFIPIILVQASSLFLQCLGATFTMHAIGSTIWLYTHATDVIYWQSLMPLVGLERLVFALIMLVGYYALESIQFRGTTCHDHY